MRSVPVGGRYKPFRGFSPSSRATTVVTKTLLPHTTGLDQPRPGMAVFHATFSVALQRSGSAGSSSTTPVMAGPRHWVQWSAASADTWPIEAANAMARKRTVTRGMELRTTAS